MTVRRKWLIYLSLLLTSFVGPSLLSERAAAQEPRQSNNTIKLNELPILARFIELMMTFSSSGQSEQVTEFQICLTYEADVIHKVSALNDYVVKGRRIVVQREWGAANISANCNIAFFSKTEIDAVDYRTLADAGVLTISDKYDFARNGGVLEVEFLDDKIAFFVTRRKIKESTLKPNSNFLRMASDIY